MTILQLFRVLNRNLNLLFLCSLALMVTVFFFTRGLPKSYQSSTEIYTGIATGMEVENLGGRVDYVAANNEFSNLLNVISSKETAVEVGERLLAKHLMLDGPKEGVLSKEGYEAFLTWVTPEVIKLLKVEGDYAATVDNVKNYRKQGYDTYRAQQIFESMASPYSHSAISRVDVKRIGTSDIIRMSYSWSQPGVCKQTLEILNQVFGKRLINMKVDRSDGVVTYYREKLEEAKLELEKAEQALVDFRIENKIINYGEQTYSVSASKKELEDQYRQELQIQAAAKAKVEKLEVQLAMNKDQGKDPDLLLSKRRDLANLKSRLLELEVYGNDPKKVEELSNSARQMELEISKLAGKVYGPESGDDGVSNENLVGEWLEATLELDGSKARLQVLSETRRYYDNIYDELSPLGSALSTLERATQVAETKYLELNKSLNYVFMKQQSETIASSGFTVIAPPTYPLEPVQSKQLLLVMLAAVLGFVLPLVFILLVEFLDTTVKSPIRAEELTGLKLVGAYPNINLELDYKNVNMDWLMEKSIGLISQKIRLDLRRLEKHQPGPKYVIIFSTRNDEGKSYLSGLIAKSLESLHRKILVLTPDEISESDTNAVNYEVDSKFLESNNIEDLVPSKKLASDYDFVFLELKGILSNPYPIELVEKFDLAIMVLSAKRVWNKADKYALSEFQETLGFEPRLLVNGVSPDYMDQVLGEIEKSRSALRKFFKGILTMQLRSKRLASRRAKVKSEKIV